MNIMKNYLLVFILGFLFSIQSVFCQIDTLNSRYFSNLKSALLKDENIKEVKFIQEKILKKSGFIQSMYVKYKNDPENRYWHIGKEFIYNTTNNSLGYRSNVDINTQVLTDTTFYYTENGKLIGLDIYNIKYDSAIAIKRGNDILMGVLGNYYERTPNIFKSVEYSHDGDTITEKNLKYAGDQQFVLDGDVVSYNKQMQVIKKKHFKMGTEIGLTDESRSNAFIDSRDGQTYPTIKIDQQIWIAKNLAFKPEDGKYWVYNNDNLNASKFGYLYNFETSKSVCPAGWHLPEKRDFEILLDHYGNNAFNELIPAGSSGFMLIDSPLRFGVNLSPIEGGSVFWTSSEKDKNYAWGFSIDSKNRIISFYDRFRKNSGLPVRCIKD
jgi:Fibrobacter succinogenes major domain (Fib_succ_major).